jgi:hypothetical protein
MRQMTGPENHSMRLLGGLVVAVAALALTGCPNPNDIGVQVYGSILVKTVDATSGQPVVGALVSAGSNYTCNTMADGTCPLPKVPVGKWTVSAATAGLRGSADVTVTENTQTSVTIQMSP